MTRVALVTGTASTLGLAIADRLARESIRVVRADRMAPPRSDTVALDVSDESSVAAAFAAMERGHGRLDILINAACITGSAGTVATTASDDWARLLTTNLSGVFLTCRSAIAMLSRAGGGRIVNVATVGGGVETSAAFAASTTAIIGLSRVLAGELGPANITVNCVASDPHADALGRQPTPVDIAEAAAFLCSKDAAFLTGVVLDVAGGVRTGQLA